MTTADLGAAVLNALRRWSQHHVLDLLQSTDKEESPLWSQLLHFESWYPGGLDAYLSNAASLFASQHGGTTSDMSSAAAAQDALLSAWTPSIPSLGSYAEPLTVDSKLYQDLEAEGLAAAADCAFVVVAGGLGERLGYNGIKLALPVETVTHTSYLEYYIDHIRALQEAVTRGRLQGAAADDKLVQIPMAIMTSDATHDATRLFLERHDWFGLPRAQITLLKQDVVPCLDARRTTSPSDSSTPQLLLALGCQEDPETRTPRLVMKPHGHGDVHTLLHASGLARQWLERQHKRFVHFIQDTNYLILNSTLPLLGSTVRHKWAWAFTGVPRKAKDASGALVQFTSPDDPNRSTLLNVEYHELDHFLRTAMAAILPDGDVNDPRTGYSLFPGNINHFVADLQTYVNALERSGGRTPEIFNPKLAPASSVTPPASMFKSPARLECMMQDFPRLLVADMTQSLAVGMLSFPSSLVYSPCKNDTVSAATKAAQDVPPQCASSAEHDLFAVNVSKLQSLGVVFESSSTGISGARDHWREIPAGYAKGPHIVFTRGFGVSIHSLRDCFPRPAAIKISARSTLIVQGKGITIHSLTLDGAVEIAACDGARVVIQALRVVNEGFRYEAMMENEGAEPIAAMRGYRLIPTTIRRLRFDVPGEYVVNDAGADE
ncbi:hypothetical protein PINS_up000649 [Pythium insidiosum]|nr:hypothetical protein PINS_up000649 [Pythium insidiosum]